MSERPTGRDRWRRWLVFAVVQFAVVLVLGELAVRLASPRHRGLRMLLNASTNAGDFSDAETLPELMGRTMLGFSPGSVDYGFVLNSRSFRTREYDLGPARRGLRVAALGDSFTFASGALPHEDHWTTLLENELDDRSDRPIEVLRLGVPDTGPAFQLRLWQIEVSHLAPDVVVLAFFVGNDFVDHQGDCGVFGGGDGGLSGRLASVSALYRAARNLRRVWGSGAGVWRGAGETGVGGQTGGQPVPGYSEDFDPNQPTFGRDRFLAIEAGRMALCLGSEEEGFQRLADIAAATVSELAAEVEATGAKFVVMLIPDQYQVDDSLVDEVLRHDGGSRDDYDLERPQRVLGDALDATGIQVLDLLPVFRAAGAGGALYRPRDTHWNRRGNELAAAGLADVLAPGGVFGGSAVFSDGLESGSLDAWSLVDSH